MRNTPTAIEWLLNHIDIKFIGNTEKYINKAKEIEENQKNQAYIDGYYNRLNLTQLEINSLKTK
jgi:hypothetical protein